MQNSHKTTVQRYAGLKSSNLKVRKSSVPLNTAINEKNSLSIPTSQFKYNRTDSSVENSEDYIPPIRRVSLGRLSSSSSKRLRKLKALTDSDQKSLRRRSLGSQFEVTSVIESVDSNLSFQSRSFGVASVAQY